MQASQALVIAEAKRLGMRVISLEPSWGDFDSTRAVFRAGRGSGAEHQRLPGRRPGAPYVVIRGESHVWPDGFLVERLQEPPLTVMTLLGIPLSLGGDSYWDEHLTLRVHERTYLWSVVSSLSPALVLPPLGEASGQ